MVIRQRIFPYSSHIHRGRKIRDYLFWSISNICMGGLILGIIAVLFSHFTREAKRNNDFIEAAKWSRRALIWNIITTILGVLGIIIIIVAVVVTSVYANKAVQV